MRVEAYRGVMKEAVPIERAHWQGTLSGERG
jgi:hypothetical protein